MSDSMKNDLKTCLLREKQHTQYNVYVFQNIILVGKLELLGDLSNLIFDSSGGGNEKVKRISKGSRVKQESKVIEVEVSGFEPKIKFQQDNKRSVT